MFIFINNDYEQRFRDGGISEPSCTETIFREFPGSAFWTPFLPLSPPLRYFRIQYARDREFTPREG